jgi:hypothetical protein
LSIFFDQCNIGVSYVPIIDYYDCQPLTKTFKYLLSGMRVIATNTSENENVIGPTNGVLIGDAPEAFCVVLKVIYEKRNLFDSAEIRRRASGYTWEGIVRKNLLPYLESIKTK